MTKTGSFTLVGTGIKAIAHLTEEAKAHIEQADKVFYLVTEPITRRWLSTMNPTAEDLYRFYGIGKDRAITYEEIIDCLMMSVSDGRQVCCAFYGHPSVFAYPGREVVRRLKAQGLEAKILPGVSSEDCLFADLGVDPGESGCQSFEATDFLIYRRLYDPRCSLILWQAALIGVQTTPDVPCNREGVEVLVDHLLECYPGDHTVTIYEASQITVCEPRVTKVELCCLPSAGLTPLSTLYLPPVTDSIADADMLARLRIERLGRRSSEPQTV